MSSDDELVESLVLQWYHRSESGRDTDAGEICRDRPDLLERVRARVEQLRRIDGLCRALNLNSTSADAGSEPAQPLPRLTGLRPLAPLGQGGMGFVFAAEDAASGCEVAVKVLRPDRAHLPSARARFLREARSAARVACEHVVPVLRVGEEYGASFIVMPRLDGETLADRLARGPLPAPEVLRLGAHVASALGAAHAVGVIHRGLKPSNVWLERLPGGSWRARVMDFGLALDLHDADRLTMSGFPLGTFGYMSPEQAEARPVDGRSDLFALGVVLYEAATGEPPFGAAGNPFAILDAIASRPADPAPLRAAGLSPHLVTLIVQLLEKAPDARPRSAADVAVALLAPETTG